MVTGDLLPVSLDEMLAEVEREIAVRRVVYVRISGRMTAKQDRQVTVMTAVADLLRRMKAEEALGKN
jgi:hypothetical protein